MNSKPFLILLLTVGAIPLSGAPISWSAPANITSDTDVVTIGTLAYAYSWGIDPTNVNGVPFAGPKGSVASPNISVTNQMDLDFTDFASTANPFASLSQSYKTNLIGSIFLGLQTNPIVQMTLSNLTVGHNYLMQVWVSDPRGPYNARTETISGGGGNVVTLEFSIYHGTSTPGGPGQFTVGTFTADANIQTFTLVGDTNNVVQFNMIQVRDTSGLGVPVLDAIATAGPTSMQLVSHGPFGQHYTLLTTTNLTMPLSNWSALSSGAGTFGTGKMTNIDSAATNKSQFYILRSP